MRIFDSKLGIGTQAPETKVHAVSATGIKSEASSDDAVGGKLIVEKSRVAGTGAVQTSDVIGQVDYSAKDSTGAKSVVASAQVTATEGHTGTNKGSLFKLFTTDTGGATLVEKMSIGTSGIESVAAHKLNALEIVSQNVATTATINQLSATKTVVEFTGSTATEVRGINSAHATKVILLHNRSTATITLVSENSGAAAADRLKLPNNAPILILPDSSIELFYNVTDTRWKIKSGSSSASGSGGGTKNYLGTVNNINGNGDFELSATTGWSLGVTGTLSNGLPTTTPTFGSGASGNLSISAVTSGQLAGTASLSYASSAATTAGNMLASDAFTIDIADQAKVMTVKFSYKAVTNPTNANWSGTSSNSFAWAIYDVTNSTWIIPTGGFGMTQSSGVGVCTGTFQTSSNGTQYRIVVYNANATSGAVTLYFDDFSVGPQTVAIGTIITDWMPYTPTISGFGTPSGVSFYSRRVGDSLEVQGTFTSGTSTGTVAQITYGYNGANANVTAASTSKITSGGYVAGVGFFSVANAVSIVMLPVPNQNYVQMGVQTTTTAGYAGVNGNQIASSGQTLSFFYRVPITGWASNVQVSSETDTRVVSFTGTQVTQAVTADVTNISFTASKDTHGAWSTNIFTVPVAGDYLVSGTLTLSSTASPKIYKNGSFIQFWTSVGTGVLASSGATLLAGLVPGDTISIRCGASVTVTDGSVGIFRLSGPSVVAASESVRAIYQTAAGQSIPNNAATTVVFGTRIKDTHNSMNSGTGVYTCPVSGGFRVSVSLYWSTAIVATATDVQIQIFKNGSIYLGNNFPKSGTGSAPITASGSFTVECNAGDTIEVKALQNTGSAQTLLANAVYNWVSIERVGN